ncbi:aladin-like [Prorops nasuta]|uniref:aladin-like n=1 Tax=Prorops nasuta TaxID=863751 RepID=UPI0034CE219A
MLKIPDLRDFPAPVFDNVASVGVINSEVQYCRYKDLKDELQEFFKYVYKYPEINITSDMLSRNESVRTIGAGDLFLPIQDSAYKRIISAWREKGFIEAVSVAAAENPENITKTIHWVATRLKWILDVVDRGIYQRDTLPTSGSGSVADVVLVRDWNVSLVRCLSWHPQCNRIAVATRDDRIRIYSEGILEVPVMRHSAQKSVCAMSWRPYAGRELAVACQGCVLFWTIELGAASNSLSHAICLRQRNHAPVTSVVWNPEGTLLVSCSPMDLNMIVWNVASQEGIPLKRVGGGGLSFIRFSLCGARLFAATCRNVFRVWSTSLSVPWTVERWTVPVGRVAAACFGPNLTLLFASTEEPATIFSLPLQETIFEGTKTGVSDDAKIAVPLIDMTKVTFSSAINADRIVVGGRIISLDWDNSGRYLAVLFQDSPVVVLLKTKVRALSTIVDVKPCCLIQGFFGESPNGINFYQRPNPHEVCLTIAWSSGRVQHFPIVESELVPNATGNSSMINYSGLMANEICDPNLTMYG